MTPDLCFILSESSTLHNSMAFCSPPDQEAEGAARHADGDGPVCGCYGQEAGHGLTYGDLQGHRALLQDPSSDRSGTVHQGTRRLIRRARAVVKAKLYVCKNHGALRRKKFHPSINNNVSIVTGEEKPEPIPAELE